jgi:hypothetical protein
MCERVQRLVLRAAVSESADARTAWEEWRRTGGDIDTAEPAIAALLPLVYRNLEAELGDDPDSGRLKGIYRHTWVSNQHVARRIGEALAALGEGGVQAMVLKGPAVGAHYRDGGARRLDDAGLLVIPHEGERALAVLRASGWESRCRTDAARVLGSRSVLPLTHADGGHINLHCRVLPGSVDDRDFWTGAVTATVGGTTALAPGATEQLLHACGHGVRAGRGTLLWIADAGVLIASTRDEIDWARFVDGVAERQIPLTTTASLAVVREALAAPIPDGIMEQLAELPPGPGERLQLRLASRPGAAATAVQMWTTYRRRTAASAASDGHVYRDFLDYAAAAADLPSRRAVLGRLTRRAR